MKTSDLVTKIEAILFYTAESVSFNFLAKTLDEDVEEIKKVVGELGLLFEKRGVRLVVHNNEVSMVTAPELAPVIEKLIKEERERDLGRAGIETLSIIAYKGPVTKKEIEYVRGVNSQYALRNLLLRGLIEKTPIKGDERMVGYGITGDTLRFLGLSHISELPEYNEVRAQLEVEEDATQEIENDLPTTEIDNG